MKNLFEIDSNEIKRILSLHEESTKKQYLNVISEALTDEQKKERVTKCGYKDWESYKKGRNGKPWDCSPKKASQTFATQNIEFTKQIQTSLGTTSTGQVTDTDLDQILLKLK
jgi:hypothetical protein